MPVREAKVPLALLQDPGLNASAKVVWSLSYWDALRGPVRDTSITQVARRTGLTRPTIRQALDQLRQSGWRWPPARFDHGKSPGASQRVRMPVDLLCDRALAPQARVIYGILQAVPGFRHPDGEATFVEIGRLARRDPRAVRNALRQLASTGWIDLGRASQRAPIYFTLRNPIVERLDRELARVIQRIERAEFRGEALMREYLSLLVDSDQFEDDAAPGFLVNPLTGERLQFDRYYPPSVAFEFNGPQHYHATERFTAEDAEKQRARDLIKLGLCVEKGITLIVVHAEDLTLDTMRKKVEGHLPLRRLDGWEELAAYLEEASRPYRRWARRQWRRGTSPMGRE